LWFLSDLLALGADEPVEDPEGPEEAVRLQMVGLGRAKEKISVYTCR